MPKLTLSSRILIGVLLGLVAIVATSLIVIQYSASQPPAPTPSASDNAGVDTFSGTLACLPHKKSDGPQTLECAYGLKINDDYYAIDTTFFPSSITSIPTGDKVIITGKMTPIAEIPNAGLEKYDIKGTILLSDIERVK